MNSNHGSGETKPAAADLGFDPDALRKKYREERDKRIRPDGVDQYVQVSGEFAHFLDDRHVEPGYTRAPLTDEVDVVLIGGGFGGILTGARLRQAGVENIRIIEKGGGFGGTWYWNRYPGVSCDIESYVYLPMLEEMDFMPKEKYSSGQEILTHARAIAEKHDLYRDVCFRTVVTELRWDEDSSHWIISTDRGDTMKARFVCMANGFLERPKLPGIPGIESFKGHVFHTCRWDFAYTGGDAEGNLSGLQDQRVGIIGTGASAIQSVPHLGESAQHLYVFQRTPSPVDVRNNHPTDSDWSRSLEPGWHQQRMDNFQFYTAGGSQEEEDLVNDGWTDIVHKRLAVMQSNANAGHSALSEEECLETADFIKMEEIRARVDTLVDDPVTAEALKPYYRPFCKRPCFHDEYLQTFNRPNVTLVDTHGVGVERVTEKGVVVAGEEYELDCLIYATGFEVWTEYARRVGFETYGRDGLSLSQKWKNGITTLHGMHIHGFPNCFMMSIAQSGVTMNFTYILNEQSKNLAHTISRALEEGVKTLEVSEEAESEWVDKVLQHSDDREDFFELCTPGYINNEGGHRKQFRQNGFFFGEPTEFKTILEDWRAEGGMKGLVSQTDA
ncbi:MAG: monooxygenase [Deltaproteobacteria bacterium]|nr:monooxygenase [Deltaproteobacteria bacterium]